MEKLLTSRISEQKVQDMLETLEKRLRTAIAVGDNKLSERISENHVESQATTERLQSLNNLRLDQLHLEVHTFKEGIANSVQKEEYIKTVAKLDDLQRGLEGELDAIQSHVRENKDKQHELIKRFQQLLESDDMKSALLDSSDKIIGMNRLSSPTMSPSRNLGGVSEPKDLKDTQDSGRQPLKEPSTEFDRAQRRTIDSKLDSKHSSHDDRKGRKNLSGQGGCSRQLQMLKRQASIKQVNQESMTSKERQGFINSKVAQFEDAMAEVEEHLKSI